MGFVFRPGDSKNHSANERGALGSEWPQDRPQPLPAAAKAWSAEPGQKNCCSRLLGGLPSPDLLIEKGWEISAPSLVLTINAPSKMASEQPLMPCPVRSLDPEVPWLAAAASSPLTRKIPINP